jgi:hypothetical protein
VTASQGTGTGTGGAWKVDGSAVTQPVSGTVGIDPSHNTVKLDPSSTATVTSGDQTTEQSVPVVVPPLGRNATGSIATAAFKTVRVNIICTDLTPLVGWALDADGVAVLASGDCSHFNFTQSFDVPGLSLTVNFANGDTTDHTVTVIVDGRSN